MSASPDTIAAFEAWKLATLATHYAAPCPDEVMNELVERAGILLGRLASAPTNNADDLVLKLFPDFLDLHEPGLNDDPMLPRYGGGEDDHASRSLFEAILEDFRRLSPSIAHAMAAPHQNRRRDAA